MRRQEMARRRRNLSEKRNEEVKVRILPNGGITTSFTGPGVLTRIQMETINKLLKKQAPKINKKAAAAAAAAEMEAEEDAKANPAFVRWVNRKQGSVIGVPGEMIDGPLAGPFVKSGSGKMVEEVA